MYELNAEIKSMYCIKCGAEYPAGDYFCGCPQCLEKGKMPAFPSGMTAQDIKAPWE